MSEKKSSVGEYNIFNNSEKSINFRSAKVGEEWQKKNKISKKSCLQFVGP